MYNKDRFHVPPPPPPPTEEEEDEEEEEARFLIHRINASLSFFCRRTLCNVLKCPM